VKESIRYLIRLQRVPMACLTFLTRNVVLSSFLFLRLLKKIWESQIVSSDWAQAFITLLSKSDILDDPAEFRPIAITNTVGKIFFSIVSDRLQKLLLANKYIRRSLQKGFLSGVPGCLEHSFSLYEALRNDKQHTTSDCSCMDRFS
jgi:hypothetical protein